MARGRFGPLTGGGGREGNLLLVSLATNNSGSPTKTAAEVATAIEEAELGFSAEATGNGESILNTNEGPTQFAGGA